MEAEDVGQDRGRDVLQERDEGGVACRPGVDSVVEELAAEAGRGGRAAGQQAREEPAGTGDAGADPGVPGRGLGELPQERGQLGGISTGGEPMARCICPSRSRSWSVRRCRTREAGSPKSSTREPAARTSTGSAASFSSRLSWCQRSSSPRIRAGSWRGMDGTDSCGSRPRRVVQVRK